MPTNSRWRWQICTKTAKTVLLAGASIMLIMLNSLCWQQRLVRLWKERSKPFLRSLWMVFQMARLTNKGRFAVLAHSREVCCCLSHVSTLRGCWRQLASGMGRVTKEEWLRVRCHWEKKCLTHEQSHCLVLALPVTVEKNGEGLGEGC